MQVRRIVRNTLMAGVLVAMTAMTMSMLGASPKQDAPPQDALGGMPDLPAGIAATPGCLGVETGRMESGKQVIFAWFEDKAAVRKWYFSEMHQGVKEAMAPGLTSDHGPLYQVADDEGPILVIVSLTMSEKPQFESMPDMPISQISIELFKPLPGGAFLGSRLAPDTFKVPNMNDITPPGAEDGE